MKPKVYLETTIVSYLTAWTSRDLVTAAMQATTREWWTSRKDEFELYVSQTVMEEARAGDADAAERRIEALKDCLSRRAWYELSGDLELHSHCQRHSKIKDRGRLPGRRL